MTLGFAAFIACTALGAGLAVVACRRTWHWEGRGAAAREAVVMALSLAAYTGVCLWLGFSIAAQLLAVIVSAVPLLIGRRYLPPSIRDYLGGIR